MTQLVVRNNKLPIDYFWDDFDRFFNIFFPDFPKTNFEKNWPSTPVSRVYVNRKGDWKIDIAVTGFTKDDIRISVEDNVISISANYSNRPKKEDDDSGSEWRCTYQRLKTASFNECFAIPSRLAAEKLEASYENGMLTLIIPIKEEAVAKNIEIK